MANTRDCTHGQLRRSCDRCEDAETIKRLVKSEADAFALGWRCARDAAASLCDKAGDTEAARRIEDTLRDTGAAGMSIASLLKRLDAKDAEIARLTDELSRLARHVAEQAGALARLAEQRDALLAACERGMRLHQAIADALEEGPMEVGEITRARCQAIADEMRAALEKARSK